MKTYSFHPTDVLFVRDARPIDLVGGHGARWPDPPLIFDALHAALHRAFPTKATWEHEHCTGVSSKRAFSAAGRTQRFGALATAGIFPIRSGDWLFPAPADWRTDDSGGGKSLAPLPAQGKTNLPAPLTHTLANRVPPSKRETPPWWTKAAWDAYLRGGTPPAASLFSASDLYSGEWMTGIGIDPETQTQDGERIYSAEYLRLRENVAAGFFATLPTKQNGGKAAECIGHLFAGDQAILIGGQQRACTVREDSAAPDSLLPVGTTITGCHVKWILLAPAIFPSIAAHPGGWLPTWIDAATGQVQLLDGPGKNKAKRSGLPEGKPISARLVAACIPKPKPISGWSERLDAAKDAGAPDNRGPRATQLAVPSGAVYYFEASSPEAAKSLAAALNWHGPTPGPAILNRRSTLLGEKGLGLGVCAPWTPATP